MFRHTERRRDVHGGDGAVGSFSLLPHGRAECGAAATAGRALITRPAVLFGDEPTGALDTVTSRQVLTSLRELVDGEEQTTVLVTHDPVAANSSRIYGCWDRSGWTGAGAGVPPWSRRLIGGLLLAAGLALLARSLWADLADLLKRKTYTTRPMILITGVAVPAPGLVGPVVRLLVRLPGAGGLLIRENAATSGRRTAAVAAPVLVTVALAGSLPGSAWTVAGARTAEGRARTRAQFVVTGEEVRVPAVPGATVSASASTAVFAREGGTALVRSDARAVRDVRAFAEVTRLPVVAGDVREVDDRSIVVNEEWERHTVGTWVRVRLGDGRAARLRIVAVPARGTGDDGAYVTAANAAGTGTGEDRLDVRVAGGAAERARVVAELRTSGGTVRSAGAWLAEVYPQMGIWGGGGGRGGARTRLGVFVVLGISLAYAGISLATTLLTATSARRGELRPLGLTGASQVQVLGVVVGEALVAVEVVAAGVGGAAAFLHLGVTRLSTRG